MRFFGNFGNLLSEANKGAVDGDALGVAALRRAEVNPKMAEGKTKIYRIICRIESAVGEDHLQRLSFQSYAII